MARPSEPVGERALVSCQALAALFEVVEQRGLPAEQLVGERGRPVAYLRNRRNRMHWDELRNVLGRLSQFYTDAEIVEIGRHLVHTEAQRPFGLIARYSFTVAGFYRAVFASKTGWGRPMFPCVDSTFAQLGPDHFEATLTVVDGFEPSHEFALITRGNIVGMPEVLGEPPADVRMEIDANTVRYDIRARQQSSRLTRLRRRITLPFRSREIASDLKEAHESLRARYDALQDALAQQEATAEALRQSETRLRLTLESVDMAVWEWDIVRDEVTLDDVAQRMFGADQSVLSPARELLLAHIHDDDRARVEGQVESALSEGAATANQFRIVRDGAVRTILTRGHVILDASGRPVRVIGVGQDVTEELRRTERHAHLGRLVESSPFEVYVADLETGRFMDVNSVARENLGYTMEELRALAPWDLNESTDEEARDAVAPLLGGETDQAVATVRHRRKDGSAYIAELSMHTSVVDSRPALVAIGVDVTERVRAERERRTFEQQLWRVQKLEALGMLASGIAHDFNNLLTSVSGYTELAARQLSPDSPAAAHLDRVRRAAERGKSLAGQVLTFGRATGGEHTPTELASIVGDALELVAASLPGATPIDAELCESGCVVRADPGQLAQVVTNLCTNAADASIGRNSGVEVRLQTCELDDADAELLAGLRPGRHALLTVSDHGVGIAPEVMDRIFDPFFTTREAVGGTGLGLAVVHGIVEAHNGAIDVESEEGRGTTVRVYLPCEASTAATEDPPDGVPRRRAGAARPPAAHDVDQPPVRRHESAPAPVVSNGAEQTSLVLFERSADAIWVMRGDRFVDCNPAAVAMMGYPSKAALLHDLHDAHPADFSPPRQPDGTPSRELAERNLAITFERGSHTFEWVHTDVGGRDFLVEVQLTVVEQGEEPLVQVVWRDIRARRELEEELRRAQRSEAVGRLAAGLAHEFNNLLAVVIGRTDLLAKEMQRGDVNPAHVRSIRAATDRATVLTRQLRAFSRDQATQVRVVDVVELVRDLGDLLRRLVGDGVELVLELGPDPLVVVADPSQLEQVVLNLAVNGRDAMPVGGRIEVSVDRVQTGADVAGLAPGSYVSVRVADTGDPMTTEEIEHAFDLLSTGGPLGTGRRLGMAAVKAIADQYDGVARIHTAAPSGTVVEVLLPLSERRIDPVVDEADRPLPGAGETILLVEDEQEIRELFESVLTADGYEVLVAVDGLDALERISASDVSVDLVVTDVVMPRLSGPDLVHRLSATWPGLKAVFVTGYADEAEIGSLSEQERRSVLPKPLTPTELQTEVRRMLDDPGVPAR